MSWWRRRPEVRGAGGYTETRLLEQFTRAISGNVRHGALGGLQCAAGAVARAFAAAEVEGDADGLLDPTTLYQMGFDLVREGQRPSGCLRPAQGVYGCHGRRRAAMFTRARRLANHGPTG